MFLKQNSVLLERGPLLKWRPQQTAGTIPFLRRTRKSRRLHFKLHYDRGALSGPCRKTQQHGIYSAGASHVKPRDREQIEGLLVRGPENLGSKLAIWDCALPIEGVG
ncbi:Hypothetical predicted protein [Pelobates cultripes]|uniref:Uncharacterized protein n=1 Tax=Pelobates cultripes TaxID=61616 RepID=A0AAD1W6S0_PELCU|nr:Hypothetical predicted protein [Pelobates cultripes]